MMFEELSFKEAPNIRKLPGPKSLHLLKLQQEIEGKALSYPLNIPVVMDVGRGATIKDVDGNVFIDFFGGAGVIAVGHCNPVVMEAVRNQQEKITHTLDFPTEIRLELIEKVETVPEKKEVVNPKKIKKRERKKRKHKVKKEEIKPKRKIGGGSFIASGILSILVPAMFYVVLGDFSSFLEECSLPFSSVDIGNDMIVNCTEMRFVYILSFLCVFFGAIFIIYGLAKKIKGMKKSPE